ncbi:LysR family transcriptional regulator [Vibrio sp. 10N.261.51.F12]|uniref:LysR family transcriptional regulator n=1 Tax=Vibrio sp. 10N.261.51.F12 TaxID=3229679 RepID=UPI00355119E4
MNRDLNLLRLLVVLSEEKQTIRAAKRLRVSQPTISVMLQKLREQFQDPLFVRNKNLFEPTTRCNELLVQLPMMLEELDALYVNRSEWQIDNLTGEISLIFSPPLMNTLAIPMVSKISLLAPEVTVNCYQWGFDALRDLELKANCWGFNYLPMETSKYLMQKDIGEDEFVLVMRAKHPVSGNTVEDYIHYPICINLIQGETEFSRSEKLIKALNINKHINIRTSDLGVMLGIVKQSDYLGIVPKNTALNLSEDFRFEPLPKSLTQEAQFRPFSLFSHQRNRMDPFTEWLFQESKAIIEANRE